MNSLRSIPDLAPQIFTPSDAPALQRVAARYAVAITPEMAALIDRDDPADPIARQFVPDARELETRPEERADPIGDHVFSPVKGIVHRHPDRVLLKPLHICPVYCRFCFRREMVGPDGEGSLTAAELDAALAYIRAHPEIWEVILTGGDPFMLSRARIEAISEALAAIPHVKIVRWHTRVPLVDPSRVTAELVAALKTPRRDALGRDPCQSSARVHRSRKGRHRAPCRRRHSAGEPDRAAARRQRQRRNAGNADADFRREPRSSRTTSTMRTLRRALRISGPR